MDWDKISHVGRLEMRLTRYEEIIYQCQLQSAEEHLHIVGLQYAAVRGIDHVHPRIFDEMSPRGDIDV